MWSIKALEVNISKWIFHYQDAYLDLNDSGWSVKWGGGKEVQIVDWSGIHYIIAIFAVSFKIFSLTHVIQVVCSITFFFWMKKM